MTQRLEPDRAAWLLAFDIAQLAVLLFLTGGLQNPFSFLLLGPVLISATALPPRMTLMLGGFAIAVRDRAGVRPLAAAVGRATTPLDLPADLRDGHLALDPARDRLHRRLHAWQIAEEARQLADALAATELVLAREQHLSQLDGLAAAAAHELGTPLSTIAVVAKELERAMRPDSPHADDVRLLREQAQRCRDILAKLTELSSSGEPFDRMPLSALIEEVVAPHRNFGIEIDVALPAGPTPPSRSAGAIRRSSTGSATWSRTPSTSPASGSRSRPRWTGEEVAVTIARRRAGLRAGDHGPASASPMSPAARPRRRRGRPTSERRAASASASSSPRRCWSAPARRSTFANRPSPERGAVVQRALEPGRFRAAARQDRAPDATCSGPT